MTDERDDRVQFAFWFRAELGARFRRLVARKKRSQRESAEQAIERWCEAEERETGVEMPRGAGAESV